MNFLNPARWMMGIGLIASLVLAYYSWEKHIRSDERSKVVSEYNEQIAKQKEVAWNLLEVETAKTNTANKALRDFKDQQENTDVINTKTIELLADKLHSVQLRDPGQVAGCRNGSDSSQSPVTASSSTGTADATSSTGILSTVATDFLLNQAKIADILNLAYISCRNDSINIRR